ncbi:MAG TPA: trypsin-like peptidase domain-containing protein [Syntrophales bacterium]|nr:trypsin-like peptidase domain-containing protein [Syntrophales bacterium]
MFADAVELISGYTFPVIISQKYYDGSVGCGCASFIVLNDEGWILTSAHILQVFLAAQNHRAEIAAYEVKKGLIEKNNRLTAKQKRRQLKELNHNGKWIVRESYWWSSDTFKIDSYTYNNFYDLAVGKIENYDGKMAKNYPVFMNPKGKLPTGTSLCRMGFPFHNISASFDEAKNMFVLAPGTLPVPRFPIEGIHTRVRVVIDRNSGKQARFIETSSPGLKGQSGGPIFDVKGRVWGLQSRTEHLDLGFRAKIKRKEQEIEENQFLNVGLGTHVEDILDFLKERKIDVQVSSDLI